MARRVQLLKGVQGLAWPPGHFYSPLPSLDEVRSRDTELFSMPESIPGLDLNAEGQLALVERFKSFYEEQPFTAARTEDLRYYFDNSYFSYADALVLYCMLRHLEPARIVEVGSGFSSALILDVNERFLDGRARCTFIEPYPDRLLSLLKPDDRTAFDLVEAPLQDVDLQLFEELGQSDVLFIDSSHVAKIGSDVNKLYLEVLPALRVGVTVHVHDILYPFEYPKDWIYSGRAWNEAYLLRAFLSFNERFRIMFFNSYLRLFHSQQMVDALPLSARNPGGSLWLERVA